MAKSNLNEEASSNNSHVLFFERTAFNSSNKNSNNEDNYILITHVKWRK